MSRTLTTTLTVKIPTKQQQLMSEIRRVCPAIEAVPGHRSIRALARDGIAKSQRGAAVVGSLQLTEIDARRSAIAASPAILAATRAGAPGAWSKSERLLAESRRLLSVEPARAAALAADADRALRTALETTADALAVEEMSFATTVLETALRDMGCRTSTAVTPGAAGIWAERGHQLIAVLVQEGDQARIDCAGFEGNECVAFHEELEHAVAAQAGAYDGIDIDQHEDPSGGVLIRTAARAAGPGGDMARALVAQAAAPRERFTRGAASPGTQDTRSKLKGAS